MNTAVVFIQGGINKRIGNTLTWIENAYEWCMSNQFEFYFPMASNVFGDLLSLESGIFQDSSNAFHENGADSLLALMKGAKRRFDPFVQEFEPNVYFAEILHGKLLYIDFRGKEWKSTKKLVDFIKRYEVVFINEPFPFRTEQSISQKGIYLSDLAHKYIADTKSTKTKVVLHIRQGDYKNWRGGKHYRDDDFYNSLLSNLRNDFRQVDIEYCHNGEFVAEAVNFHMRKNYDKHELSAVNVDFLSFVSSDFIIGPPSTFTGQAKIFAQRFSIGDPSIITIKPEYSELDLFEKISVVIGAQK